MSTKTQNNALESAELGAKVDAIVQIVQEMAQEKPTSVNAYGLSTWTKAKKLITDLVKSYSAPVAAQPDLTQQTLDDVMAGIPARDAEIEALRKEIDTLRAQHDADKVDAERYRAWRDAAVANSTPFVRAMRDTLPPEAREGKPRWPTASEWNAAIDAARKEQA